MGTAIVTIALVAALGYLAWTYFGKGGNEPDAAGQAVRTPPPPMVTLHVVENADLAVSREYIGRVEPIQLVALRPQVAGEISKVHFKEGSVVKAGDLLFTLDNRQFAATVELRRAEVAKAEADYGRAVKYLARLLSSDRRSVSAADLDIAENDELQCKAAVSQAKAALKLAQIDLDRTRITAPITGRIGKAAFTKGNYVSPAGGVLAEIAQLNPIRVAFPLPDRDYLEQQPALQKSDGAVYNAKIRLADGSVYPFSGKRDFEENAMDEATGTIMMRLRFSNEKGALVPGEMVRVETKPARSHVAALIPQEVVMADAGGDYVYVIDGEGVAHQRRVGLGAEIGTMREVVSGLAAGERVVFRGLQSVRPEHPVTEAPIGNESGSKTPAERAMESGYDIKPAAVSPDAAGAAAEGKN
ncbi:MAG: efflux RND transporter periplasmic adaptor subunit [Synergistaceae bacterium]|nr:efflux RND transporter periplasmic adaptor subunit [Synergistaceae bacterium]